MIIDFHTHTFPDKIAEKTIAFLSEKGGIPAYRQGTLSSLKESQRRAGIDYSVVLPVATAPRQVERINELAFKENGKEGIICAGAIHPDCENIEDVLDKIKKAGLFGIKIHPDYQGVNFDDERYIKIMAAAAKRGLITITHAGIDVGYKDFVRCTPDAVLNVLKKLKGVIDFKLVLAHMGGCDMPKEVERKLVGKNVYFDTAFVLDRYPEDVLSLIKAHGADRILFATDSPWADQKKFIDILNGFDLSAEEKEKIFYKNAERLLAFNGDEYIPRPLS